MKHIEEYRKIRGRSWTRPQRCRRSESILKCQGAQHGWRTTSMRRWSRAPRYLMRKLYANVTGFPLEFLRNLSDGRGIPYIREISASRMLKWMSRVILMRHVASRWHTWTELVRWYRWLRTCRRAAQRVRSCYIRRGLRLWKMYTANHRATERLVASLRIQRTVRGHLGRLRACCAEVSSAVTNDFGTAGERSV